MAEVAYIALGSNLGDRERFIRKAVDRLRSAEGVLGVILSALHETAPVGGPAGQGVYLNAAACVETTRDVESLLGLMLETERLLGRQRGERWAARTIDLDLLLYGRLVMDKPGLTVPHPRMHERLFVLEPLAEIAPEVVHPVLGRTIAELLGDLKTMS